MLECVINVSEGRNRSLVDQVAAAAGGFLLDVHVDGHHHRSVLTMAGADEPLVEAVKAVVRAGVGLIDLTFHAGVHPRLGAVDVVPFVPLPGPGLEAALEAALSARDELAAWAADELAVPCFLYGPERSLPDIRRRAFRALAPDRGPARPHPTAGAMCVGARPVLVAYNLWLAPGVPLATAMALAADLRSPAVRALGLDIGGTAQVSMNLVDPLVFGPAAAYDAAASAAPVARAELVGLLPEAVLAAIDPDRWAELDLRPSSTVEARLEARRETDAGP